MLEDTSGRFGDVWELTSDGKTTTSRLVYAAGTPEAEAFMAQGPHDLDPPEPTFDEAEKEAAKPPEPVEGAEDLPDDVRDGRIDDDAEPVAPTEDKP